MTYSEAEKVIVDEAFQLDGFVTDIRGGDDPESERVRRLLDACEIVFVSLQGEKQIDRGLAAALNALTACCRGIHCERKSSKWRKELIDVDCIRIEDTAASILEDDWHVSI